MPFYKNLHLMPFLSNWVLEIRVKPVLSQTLPVLLKHLFKYLIQNHLINYSINSLWRWKVKVLVTQSCPTLYDPMDCSPPGSSVHRILQARILEWVAISFSRGSSWPRDWTWIWGIAVRLFTDWATREDTIHFEI